MADKNEDGGTFCINKTFFMLVFMAILVGLGIFIGNKMNEKKVTTQSKASEPKPTKEPARVTKMSIWEESEVNFVKQSSIATPFRKDYIDFKISCYNDSRCWSVKEIFNSDGVFVKADLQCIRLGQCADNGNNEWCGKVGKADLTDPDENFVNSMVATPPEGIQCVAQGKDWVAPSVVPTLQDEVKENTRRICKAKKDQILPGSVKNVTLSARDASNNPVGPKWNTKMCFVYTGGFSIDNAPPITQGSEVVDKNNCVAQVGNNNYLYTPCGK